MRYLYFFLFALVVFGCETGDLSDSEKDGLYINGDTTVNTTTKNASKIKTFLLDSSAAYVDSVVQTYLQTALNMKPQEVFTYKIHKELLNPDQIPDAIISVNRLSFAKQKAEASGHVAQAEKLAYMGPFNSFIFYDGRSNSFSSPISVPSSPLLPLNVSFEYISSNRHKDMVLDFRIRNSSYKEVYFLFNNKPSKVFQWKNFDGLGNNDSEAYSFEFKASNGPVKDIIVYNAQIEEPKTQIDPFIYKPNIVNSDKLKKKFFYVPAQGKYFSTKDAPEG